MMHRAFLRLDSASTEDMLTDVAVHVLAENGARRLRRAPAPTPRTRGVPTDAAEEPLLTGQRQRNVWEAKSDAAMASSNPR
jgi:hypothetical protein